MIRPETEPELGSLTSPPKASITRRNHADGILAPFVSHNRAIAPRSTHTRNSFMPKTSLKKRHQRESKDATSERIALPGDTVRLRDKDGRIYQGRLFPFECGHCAIIEVAGVNYAVAGFTVLDVEPRPRGEEPGAPAF